MSDGRSVPSCPVVSTGPTAQDSTALRAAGANRREEQDAAMFAGCNSAVPGFFLGRIREEPLLATEFALAEEPPCFERNFFSGGGA
jgi:hypothetical protein